MDKGKDRRTDTQRNEQIENEQIDRKAKQIDRQTSVSL